MDAKVSTLTFFPTFVWVFDLQPGDHGSLNEAIARKVEDYMPPSGRSELPHSVQSATDLHRLPEFAPLMDFGQRAGQQALEFLDHEPSPMRVTGCWANVGAPGTYHVEHSHPNNFLSAVYYVRASDEAGKITFHDPRLQAHVVAPRVKKKSLKHASSVNITVAAGRMVMFPAWLRHSVDPNVSDDLRISVSFNLMFEDFTEEQSAPRFKGKFEIKDSESVP